MPCWTIHLGVASKLNEELKLNKDKILYGSVLPDVLKSNPYGRGYSHFFGTKYHDKAKEEVLPDLDKFLNTYKDKLDKDLIIGYYIHLLTDYYFNNKIYQEKYITDENGIVIGLLDKDNNEIDISDCSHKETRRIKQQDFLNFGKYLYENNLLSVPTNVEEILKELPLLEDKFITEEEVRYRVEHFNSKDFSDYNTGFNKENLQLYSFLQYQNMYDECTEFCKQKIKKI